MTDQTLTPMQLRAQHLRLWGLLAHWHEIDPELREKLCNWQETERRNRSMAGRLAASRLGRFKTMADFDWQWPESIDREGIEEILGLGFMSEAANVILMRPQKWDQFSFGTWLQNAAPRMHRNKLATALANKLARIAWSVLRNEKAFDTHRHEVTAI